MDFFLTFRGLLSTRMDSPDKVRDEKDRKQTDISLRPNGRTAAAVKAKTAIQPRKAGKAMAPKPETGRFAFKPNCNSKISSNQAVKRLGNAKRDRNQISPGERKEPAKKVSLETGKSEDSKSEVAASPITSKVGEKF